LSESPGAVVDLDAMSLTELHHIVHRYLRTWTGFQLALRLGTGGSLTEEKAKWFEEVNRMK
jgi:hypothetical protein